MFETYPLEAVTENWIHESLTSALRTIISNAAAGILYPDWPEIIPEAYRGKFRLKRKIRNLLPQFSALAAVANPASRLNFLELLASQNKIAQLLDGSLLIPVVEDDTELLYSKGAEIFEEGFCLLAKTKVRDDHYKIIYDSLSSKTCPFCGYEALDAPGLPREDEDHYLLRAEYHLAAANLMNLVPMGGRCNSSFKLQQNIIEKDGARRKALNPYGEDSVDIDLLNSDLFGNDFDPEWNIKLVPDTEESRTWEDVFSIRIRLKESVLVPMYDGTLDEINDWFKNDGVYSDCSDAEVISALERLALYKKRNKEQGLGFLKDKVVETITHYYRQGNLAVIGLVRDALGQRVFAV